jgi:alpha-galactosidase
MNKKLYIVLLALLGLTSALKGQEIRQTRKDSAYSLAGCWRLDLLQAGNFNLATFFIIHEDSGKYEGSVIINGSANLPFRKQHMEGDELVFSPGWNRDYRLSADGDQLKVTIVYSGGGSQHGVAVRVPLEETYPPKPLQLPELKIVAYNGLAKTPPMGWNSWNHFAGRVNDSIVRAMADRLVSSGLAKAGYVYINIDDCWEGHRDAGGNIIPNDKFPDMKALAGYVHRRGLKLGIYSSPGPLTCGGYPGSYGHEEQDANTYAAWGIDYLKLDWCSAERIYTKDDLQAAYQKMGDALAHCGRPIVYSLCEYGMNDVWQWGPQVGANLWRTTGDIQDNWNSMATIGFNQSHLAAYAGPGHWNDPDMLEVGNGGMTRTEYRTHFSLWCLLAAPLIAGNDLDKMSAGTLAILGNKEAIAVDQDVLGQAAIQLLKNGDLQIWVRQLQDGSKAVGIFNLGDTVETGTLNLADLKIGDKARIRDLWLHQNLGVFVKQYTAPIDAHGVILLKVIPLK